MMLDALPWWVVPAVIGAAALGLWLWGFIVGRKRRVLSSQDTGDANHDNQSNPDFMASMAAQYDCALAPIVLPYLHELPKAAGNPNQLPAELKQHLAATFQPYKPGEDLALVEGLQGLEETWQDVLHKGQAVTSQRKRWEQLSADDKATLIVLYHVHGYLKWTLNASIWAALDTGEDFSATP